MGKTRLEVISSQTATMEKISEAYLSSDAEYNQVQMCQLDGLSPIDQPGSSWRIHVLYQSSRQVLEFLESIGMEEL